MGSLRTLTRWALLLPCLVVADEDAVVSEFGSSGAAAPAVFEFYYGTGCENCGYFLSHMAKDLLEAGFPGSLVQATILPVLGGQIDKIDGVHVCAMRSWMDQPAPVDSPDFVNAVSFVSCVLKITMDSALSEGGLKACATDAGVDWDGIAECVNSGAALGIVQSGSFVEKMVSATKSRPHTDSEPYLFFNAKGLDCGTPYPTSCWATYGPDGALEKLPAEGNLAYVACTALPEPRPAVCESEAAQGKPQRGAAPPAPAPGGSTTIACENCNEVGSFHWLEEHRNRPSASRLPVATAGFAGCLAMLVFATWRCARHHPLQCHSALGSGDEERAVE